MTIAALTSSISMLEVPVAYCIEEHSVPRKTAVYGIGAAISLVSIVILLNFDTLFGLVVSATTRYSEPLLGLVICIYAGWILRRMCLPAAGARSAMASGRQTANPSRSLPKTAPRQPVR